MSAFGWFLAFALLCACLVNAPGRIDCITWHLYLVATRLSAPVWIGTVLLTPFYLRRLGLLQACVLLLAQLLPLVPLSVGLLEFRGLKQSLTTSLQLTLTTEASVAESLPRREPVTFARWLLDDITVASVGEVFMLFGHVTADVEMQDDIIFKTIDEPAPSASVLQGPNLLVSMFPPSAETNEQLKLLLIRPAERREEKLPVIVYFHGGWGWRGSRDTLLECTLPFLSGLARRAGVAVASVEYRLTAWGWSGRDQVHDGLAAVKFLQDNAELYGLDKDFIFTMGRSGGALLAYLTAYKADANREAGRIRGTIGLYGQSSTEWSLGDGYLGNTWWGDERLTSQYLCGRPGEDQASCGELDALNYRPVVPTLSIYGDRDEAFHPSHAQRLHDDLSARNVPNYFLKVRMGHHGTEGAARGSAMNQLFEYTLDVFLGEFTRGAYSRSNSSTASRTDAVGYRELATEL
eukprot:TRINITY_DN47980_c0_g1_i1.p1 TRINITY_DN47980_c0_g1~~TRINITY_DN47980_c0_g1_i1.p1  ORF type:complete len:495 (+),score=67.92 TRINITY_DN47980_c0_g1_i1:99-1487(+)